MCKLKQNPWNVSVLKMEKLRTKSVIQWWPRITPPPSARCGHERENKKTNQQLIRWTMMSLEWRMGRRFFSNRKPNQKAENVEWKRCVDFKFSDFRGWGEIFCFLLRNLLSYFLDCDRWGRSRLCGQPIKANKFATLWWENFRAGEAESIETRYLNI